MPPKMGNESKTRIRVDHTIDLIKLRTSGNFPCPECNTTITPEDDMDESYEILDAKTSGKQIKHIIIKCNSCQNNIKIVGFIDK